MSYINKLLIANRGEIACRVMRTAKKMGIKTVAVYSDIDKNTLFVDMADEGYNIGPAPALQSYLRSDKIIDVALHAKAQAIHPGFGFLSENAQFSEDCVANNLIFVGPPADAMRQMASKSESKIIMQKANVPVVPGYHGENQDKNFILEQANTMGYPILIKAVMGGGGKGMKIVRHSGEFLEQLESAKREALKSFKDDRVLIEKYIEKPRHIEIQVFGDNYGNYVHFFERDCSIQRRHQKVIEEAPSALPMALKLDIGEKAKAAARAVNYTNAGTVEFIFDLEQNNYYFMEMNTRLQVEHPITEMITGVDLVELQLRAAQGERLKIKQEDITINGHSIEARIYSENPNNDFLPGNGTLKVYNEPKADDNVRIETGVRQGDAISIFYDPMISKLVVWGKTRELAMVNLHNALSNYQIYGLPNNIHFLKQILAHPEYQKWDYSTSFIQNNKTDLLALKEQYSNLDLSFAIVAKYYLSTINNIAPSLRSFRNGSILTQNFKISVSSPVYLNTQSIDLTLKVSNISKEVYSVLIGDKECRILSIRKDNDKLIFETDSGIYSRSIFCEGHDIVIFDQEGDPLKIEILSEIIDTTTKTVKSDSLKTILSPMPGTLSKVNVIVGQQVKRGDVLVIMEAMKMEHTIKSPIDGSVTEIRYLQGQFIEAGATIVKID